MALYQIVYWRDIPALVISREERRDHVRVSLSPRFQVAIDEAAMRADLTGSDAYSDQWRRSEWQSRPGTAQDVAEIVAAELELIYDSARLRALVISGGAGDTLWEG